MNAYEFIDTVILRLKLKDDGDLFAFKSKGIKDFQWINTYFCKIDKSNKIIHFGLTVDEDLPDKFLNSVASLKSYFKENDVQKDYTVDFKDWNDVVFTNCEPVPRGSIHYVQLKK